MSVQDVLGTLSGAERWKVVTRVAQARPLLPIFGVSCRRIAFEWAALRVTLDRDVTYFEVAADAPLALGRRIGHVEGVVVEVKVGGAIPEWLATALEGSQARGYSKSRYALALGRGFERPFLVAEDPRWRPPITLIELSRGTTSVRTAGFLSPRTHERSGRAAAGALRRSRGFRRFRPGAVAAPRILASVRYRCSREG